MSEIKPALTGEEWAARQASRSQESADGEHEIGHTRFGFTGMNPSALCIISGYGGSGATDDPAAFHGIAALALYGQSFGFTREDVKALREAATITSEDRIDARLYELADRIEALLPPEEK